MLHMYNEIFEQPQVIRNCSDVNVGTLLRIAALINERNIDNIYIAARGTSDNAATYGKYMFEVLTGLPVALAAASVITIYNKKPILNNSLVIGISQSGEAKDVARVVESGKDCGTITVAITNNPDSPLAKLADFNLDCAAGKEFSVAATKTFTSQMYLIGLLAAYTAGSKDTIEKLSQVPELIEQTFSAVKNIKILALKYKNFDEFIILGRGFNYAIAQESALKIMETSYVRAKAFATSDFYHGPLAILQNDIPVMVFAPKGETENDTREILKKIKAAGSAALVVTDSTDKEISALADDVLKIPCAPCDMISPFGSAVTAQLFACFLAVAKGYDPDKPRMLNKVTITQ